MDCPRPCSRIALSRTSRSPRGRLQRRIFPLLGLRTRFNRARTRLGECNECGRNSSRSTSRSCRPSHLRCQSRPIARGRPTGTRITPGSPIGTTSAAARRPAPTGIAGRPRTRSVQGELRLWNGVESSTSYQTAASRRVCSRPRFGLLYQIVRLRYNSASWSSAGGRLPSARSHPLGHVAGRRRGCGLQDDWPRLRWASYAALLVTTITR